MLSHQLFRTLLPSQSCSRLLSSVNVKATKPLEEGVAIAAKKNLPQSPLKMKWLVTLIRNAWVPDALAQLKFSPKHRAVDVAKIVRRASSIAKINFGAIPEELMVKEVMVTKGFQRKRMTIMGRGRTGFGYTRYAHVTVKVQKIDFTKKIQESKKASQAATWTKRLNLVNSLKSGDLSARPTVPM